MDVDELTIHKLKIVPTDLSKLSNEVDNDVVKKTVYDELFKKVNSIHAIDISELLKETDNDTKTKDIKKRVSTHDNHITTTEFNQFSGTLRDDRLKQGILVIKSDIADIITKTHFDEKPTNINKKVTLNKTKHFEAEKKLTHQSEIFSLISEKRFDFC